MERTARRIDRLRLDLTTACVCRCGYCFVRKTGRTLSEADARRAFELLLGSAGRRKTLLVLGGEPLLEPELLERVLRYAVGRAAELHKDLRIAVATNGLLWRPALARRFAPLPVRFSLSLDGPAEVHDAFRRTADGRPTHRRVVARARALLRALGPDRVSVLLGVHPSHAARVAESFRFVAQLGFRTVNLEPIQGVRWSDGALAGFGRGLERIFRRLQRSVAGRRPLFLSSVNRALARGRSPGGTVACPLVTDLQVEPSGELFLSPFLPHVRGSGRFAVGTLRGGLGTRHASCSPDVDSLACRACRDDVDGGDTRRRLALDCPALRTRDVRSEAWARELRSRARSDVRVRAYVERARELLFE